MLEIGIIIILILLFISSVIIIKRKIAQINKYEEVLRLYENWIENFTLTVETIDDKLDKLDSEGTFRSDDEVGFFFQSIYTLLKTLSDYGLTDKPEQIIGESAEGVNIVELYTRDKEKTKRTLKRRNTNITLEDLNKKVSN